MTIVFDKVGATPKPFSIEDHGLGLAGTLRKTVSHRVEMRAQLSGAAHLECDRCGSPYHRDMNEDLVLEITDQVTQDKDNLDIIEFLDGRIDLLYILQGEANALAADYHFCPRCEADDATLELEF